MLNRRHFLTAASGAAAAGLSSASSAWALPASAGNTGLPTLSGTTFNLDVSEFPITVNGRRTRAVGVNGSVPAPLLRFREGDEITLKVSNRLKADTSIHWHGLLLPFHMDGVPGVSFPGIGPGETFSYRFPIKQNGTYWYHSHSGLQEQTGHYGPIVIDPKDADPVAYDREYVLMLSDWSFEDPHRIFSKLKKHSEVYNDQQRTVGDFFRDAAREGFEKTLSDRAMWGEMRMSPRDLADVTASTYTYVINGHSTADNWNGAFTPGERVRLRIINASAMTIFNVRMPGLPMTVVQADGLNVQPVETDEFQIGVAETYDVIIQPRDDRAYAFVAESIDRSGQAVATFGPRPGMRAQAPALRPVPTLTMTDMGMDHGTMDHGAMNHGPPDRDATDHAAMGHGSMDHAQMDHSQMSHAAPAADPHAGQGMPAAPAASIQTGPGVASLTAMPVSRLDEPGIGLEDVPHRALRYAQLRSLDPNPDTRTPSRELQIHLTSNMERYMWSFDGVKFSEIKAPIVFQEGERLRMTLVNDTMMPHPIHLHGMFFDLVNGSGDHAPRKHTIIVKPAEKLSVDITADAVGDWAFHCHLLYHMHAGMMQVVSVLPGEAKPAMDHSQHEGMDHSRHTAPPPASAPPDHSQMDHSAHQNHDGGHH